MEEETATLLYQCSRLHPDIRQYPVNLATCLFNLHMWGKNVWTVEGPPCKEGGVMMKIVEQVNCENDKAPNSTTWLQYGREDCEYVASVKCAMCIRYQDQLRGVRNYNPALITGSINLWTSSS